MMIVRFLIFLLVLWGGVAQAEVSAWDGLWFECEFSGKQAPPQDDCAMLDDDGFLFEDGRVTYMKVIDSIEGDVCKKQRAGQCFRASKSQITVRPSRTGKAEYTQTTIGMRFLGCTQIFHMKQIKDFYEAQPDDKRCIWAGKKYFYLRKYDGIVTIEAK